MADWPFVGRRSEQERITALLRSRPPVGVVLCGPQGVGKTRLAQATRSGAAGAGVDVRHVVAGAATSAIPFGALATLLPVLRGDNIPRRRSCYRCLHAGGIRPLAPRRQVRNAGAEIRYDAHRELHLILRKLDGSPRIR